MTAPITSPRHLGTAYFRANFQAPFVLPGWSQDTKANTGFQFPLREIACWPRKDPATSPDSGASNERPECSSFESDQQEKEQ